ncbi:hypothetical protein RDI58_003148 [Solanum bulbocastanum]|uniref:Uncharacterized protein n=1 Tax=Solanum bulbocastanum TaxID=147425 RepID=A0AAN8YPL3_SOLBU
MILLKLSLVCYSVALQDKLKIPPVQKPLLQHLAFGHHELRDMSSSQKVRVEVHTGGFLTDNWFNFLFGTFIEQQALSSAIGDRDIERSVSSIFTTVWIPDRIFVCFSQQKVRFEVHTGGSLTDNWINFLFGTFIEQKALSSAIGGRDVEHSVSNIFTTVWIPERIFICFSQQKLTEDDPAETKLGMLFSSSPRQAEDSSCPETTTPTSSSSRAKKLVVVSEGN